MKVGDRCPTCGKQMVGNGFTFKDSFPVLAVRCPDEKNHKSEVKPEVKVEERKSWLPEKK